MKKLVFKIDINADRKKVWNTMLNRETYEQWVAVSWPGSSYVGDWKKGEDIKFISSSGEGTKAHLDELRPYDYILANHVAVVLKGGKEDSESDIAKGWVGTTEAYKFSDRNGKTELTVEIKTSPEWESMFSEGWPAALKKLKEMSESN